MANDKNTIIIPVLMNVKKCRKFPVQTKIFHRQSPFTIFSGFHHTNTQRTNMLSSDFVCTRPNSLPMHILTWPQSLDFCWFFLWSVGFFFLSFSLVFGHISKILNIDALAKMLLHLCVPSAFFFCNNFFLFRLEILERWNRCIWLWSGRLLLFARSSQMCSYKKNV